MRHVFQIGDYVWMRESPDLCGVVVEIRPDCVESIHFEPVGGSERTDIIAANNKSGGRKIILTARRDELEWSLLVQLAVASA